MIIPVFLFVIVFSLFIIGISDSTFADERICKQDTICVKTGDFLKYEIDGVSETKYSFNESVDENKIKYTISGFDGDKPTYEVQFILDITNGDTFEINNPDEKYSSLVFIVPIPIQIDSVDECKKSAILYSLNLRDVLICEKIEDEGELRIVFDEKTGILLEMIINAETETSETYFKLLETNIFDDKPIFESEDVLPVSDNDAEPIRDESKSNPPSASIVDGKLLSPKKQVSQGIKPENIQCKESLVLFLRDNGQPICIKPTTMQKLVERQQIDESNSQIIIKTGTHAGRCLGYCIQDFVITSERILYSQNGLEFVTDVREELPAKIKQIPISESKWHKLTDLIDLQKFNSLPERIGCPGCADDMVEWIEISDGKKTKKIEFEPKDNIPEIDELVMMLREIRNIAASSITNFEECIAAGNPAMESYPRQCRTVNGEHFIEEIDEEFIESTPEIMEKRSPVDIPDATNENDMLCQTHWNIETTEELNTEHIKESIQSTIAQFGTTYFLEEREIMVSESSFGYVVSISGLWNPESIQYSMITEDLENISGVEIQGEPAMCI